MLAVLFYFLFFGSLLGILHTYVIYPLLMRWLATHAKHASALHYTATDSDLPHVSILMAAHNEQIVLPEKLRNLTQIDYPQHLLHVFIGSDGSTDRTNQLLSAFQKQFPAIAHVFPFSERRGKPPVVNHLAQLALDHTPAGAQHLFLLTDASVMLEPSTVFLLARHFKNPQIGCVDAHMLTQHDTKGIGGSEQTYMQAETRLKQDESRAWGMMVGPFGGCYMLRSNLFKPIPAHSLVDDFYLGFGALVAGFEAHNDLEARCYERPTTHLKEEYRRKKRIATGSMKNLGIFARHLLPPTSRLGFAFLSHKVLRWFTPILLLLMWVSVLGLSYYHDSWMQLFVAAHGFVLCISVLWLLGKLVGKQIKIVQNLFYFFAMNVALLHGMCVYLKGVKTDIWEPTRREQQT